MKTLTTILYLKEYLKTINNKSEFVGFVPTMGALHSGHLSLLEMARKECSLSVVSIFVNPLQFNDKKDLEKYPRTIERDSEMLEKAHCDILFIPTVTEIYPLQTIENIKIDLGFLDKTMEGAHRPGHFQGVCTVVKRLFDIIQPTKAYFGEKDFQQLSVIKHMVKELNIPIDIVSCPTMRESNGLAMSSRNMLLTPEEKNNASLIYKTLMEGKEKIQFEELKKVKQWTEYTINSNPFLQLEYFEVVNATTLRPIEVIEKGKKLRACIAVKVGSIRLIDNIDI